ncbi:MAG: NEL-type E3 ubiquitin ligase domain-containing protein, partial [Pseudomonas sp.]
TRTMQFSTSAGVTEEMLNRAAQRVLASESPAALVSFALKREFWVTYLEERYPAEFVACRRPTELRMDALDDLQSAGRMTDGAYKSAADDILRQRKADEHALMQQLTQTELAETPGANSV